jgi:hypothetical protein
MSQIYNKRESYVKKTNPQDMGYFLKSSGGEPDRKLLWWDKEETDGDVGAKRNNA